MEREAKLRSNIQSSIKEAVKLGYLKYDKNSDLLTLTKKGEKFYESLKKKGETKSEN